MSTRHLFAAGKLPKRRRLVLAPFTVTYRTTLADSGWATDHRPDTWERVKARLIAEGLLKEE